MSTACYGYRYLLVLSVLSLIIVSILLCNNPYSQTFHVFNRGHDEKLGMATHLNDMRLRDSSNYFRQLEKHSDSFHMTNDGEGNQEIDIAIGIITLHRDHETELGYLTQTASAMGKLVKSAADMPLGSKLIFLCNVHVEQSTHEEANYLKKFFPFAERNGASNLPASHKWALNVSALFRHQEHQNRYQKQLTDYMFCLNAAYSISKKFVILVEDDAIANSDMLNVLDHFLNHGAYRTATDDIIATQNFAYIKLYYPERWQGFAFEWSRIIELLSLANVGGGIVLLFCAFWHVVRPKKNTRLSFHVHFIIGFLYFLLLALLVGRQNIMQLRKISKYLYTFRRSPGCCVPAMLYPIEIIPKLLDHLTESINDTSRRHPSDIAIYDFTLKYNIPAFQIEPNLFHHIGMHSSLQAKHKNPEEFLFDSKMK